MIRTAILTEIQNRGISVRSLAIQSGVRIATLQNFLNGKTDITVRNAEKVMKYLKLTIKN